jgi:heme a synthase
MQQYQRYLSFTRLLLIWLFVVILAGSIVRTTHSGMGCPDWPTCFGNAIPPTQEYQVRFQANHEYRKGQFIIYNDSLKYANKTFKSGTAYNPADWQQYEKNNYAKFNVYQTWIEYINRLTTGVLGFIIIAHIIWSWRLFGKTRRSIFYWSLSLLVLTAFEAWLGKIVVDTNLEVVKITLHMLFALLIAAVAVIIIHKVKAAPKIVSKQLKWLSTITLIVVLVQIVLGTEVREQIDEISLALSYTIRELWISRLNGWFVVHRDVAWAAAILCVYLFWQSLPYKVLQRTAFIILACVAGTVLLGLILMYANIPAAVQPLHLLLSSILIIALFAYRLKVK